MWDYMAYVYMYMHSMFCGLFHYNPVWSTNPAQTASTFGFGNSDWAGVCCWGTSWQRTTATNRIYIFNNRPHKLLKNHPKSSKFHIEWKRFLDFGKFTALMGVGLVVYAFYVLWTVSLQPCMKHQSRSISKYLRRVWLGESGFLCILLAADSGK